MANPREAIIPVPFRSRLIHGLEPGQTLFSHGVVKEGAKEYELNLLCGNSTIDKTLGQVALHVNARFDEGKIILNSLEGGEWGKEKRVKNPFHPGDVFDLRIRIHQDRYEVLVNQKEVAEYEHRVPLQLVDHIEVTGDIRLDALHRGGRYHQLPFETVFHDGHLKAGELVMVYGIPTGKDFEINFLGHNGEILFHYKVLMSDKHVVRNANLHGEWGPEEREGVFPFKKDTAFDLVIQNQPYSIQTFVNNKRFATFAHRTSNPRQDYHALRISGDVDLTGIEVTYPHSHTTREY